MLLNRQSIVAIVETPGSKSGQSLFDNLNNLRAKSQNNTITSRGDKYIKNGKIIKSGYQTANAFNENRYKFNRSQLGTQNHGTSHSNRPHTQSLQKSNINKKNRLRFLMEENVIFQQESDAKIDQVIQEAMQKDVLQENKEYQKLLKIIEQLNSKFVGESTKFEMRFNLDLVFGGDKDIQKFKSLWDINNEQQNSISQNNRRRQSSSPNVMLGDESRISKDEFNNQHLFNNQSSSIIDQFNNDLNYTKIEDQELDEQNSPKQLLNVPSSMTYNQSILPILQQQLQPQQQQYQQQQKQQQQFYSHDNMVLIVDLIDKIYEKLQQPQFLNLNDDPLDIEETQKTFAYHFYEIQKLFRVLFRQINNPDLNQILQSLSVWMILWLEQMNTQCVSRINLIKEQSKDKNQILESEMEKKWQKIQEEVRVELGKKDQEIEKMKVSLDRLIRDKERVEDTLRHRDSELQMLNKNPDYDMLKGMLDELANYLDECDERTLELNPQIESIRNISQLMQQLEEERRLEELKKATEVKMIKLRRKKRQQDKLNSQNNNNNNLNDNTQSQQLQPIIQEKVVVRVQKVYERITTADQPIVQPLVSQNEQQSKPMTSEKELRQRKDIQQNFICTRCGKSEFESNQIMKKQLSDQKIKKQKSISSIREHTPVSYNKSIGQRHENSVQTQLTLIREPYATIADQMLTANGKRKNTIVNNRKVLIMPKEIHETTAKQGYQSLQKSFNFGQSQTQVNNISQANTNLGDPAILKLVETAMEEMVRFEMNEQSQYQQQMMSKEILNMGVMTNNTNISQVKKVFEFREYLFDYLLTQYGLRNIAQKNYDQIIQRIYWYADRENQYAQQMMNALGTPYPTNQKVWSINKQHVCIFAKIIYNDSINLTKSNNYRGDVSPARRVSRIDINLVGDAFNTGGHVNIFDLMELMSKYTHDNPMVLNLLANIKPGILLEDDVTSIDTEFENEKIFLELAQMKIAAKLAKFGFDHKYFIETLDYKDKGSMKFEKILGQLIDRFNLHFSNAEQTAMRRYLFSCNNSNQIVNQASASNTRGGSFKRNDREQIQNQVANLKNQYVIMNGTPKSFASLLYNQQEFMSKIRLYMITKSQFIQFVLEEYDYYMEQLATDIQVLFKKYDDFYKRGGINLQQFQNLIKDDLNLMGIGNMNSLDDAMQISKLFNDALEFLEENDYLKQERLLGQSAVKEIIMERNLESLPFYSYMKNKFNQGKQFIKKLTTNSNNKQYAIGGSNSQVFGSELNSPLNKSASPMRRGTLRLKRI